jgi:hypothetical protein
MVSVTILVPHAPRVTHEDRPDALFPAKVDHLARAFMAQVSNPPVG